MVTIRKIFVFLFLGLVILPAVFLAKPVKAFTIPLGFGGMNLFSIYCANGTLLVVIGEKGGNFLLTPLSLKFAWWQYFGKIWVLGTYLPGGVCLCPFGDCEASSKPAKGTIIMMGSSPQIPELKK